MDALIAQLLICLNLTRFEAGNGLILRRYMIENCQVIRATEGKRAKKKWLNATIDCTCR